MNAIFRNIKCLLYILSLLLIINLFIPNQFAWSGASSIDIVDQTDFGSNRLVMYWDIRGRDTYFQIANISTSNLTVHVQIIDVDSSVPCVECNFDDSFTPLDTHLYDIKNIVRNSSGDLVCSERSGTYGFIVVSLESGDPNSLIGVFSIFDQAGYQYRTNAATPNDSNAETTSDFVINFSDANGNSLSDLVGIPFVSITSEAVYASPGVFATFGGITDEVLIYDEAEDDISCSPTTFACAAALMDKGIDNSLPNSKGEANRVCATSTLNSNSSGWLSLPFNNFGCTDPLVGTGDGTCAFDPFFVGFIGINNGDGTGSMDSWWSVGGNQ